jgi:chloride channel protein, CIC family
VAGYTGRFWSLVALLGVAAGLGAAALIGLLRLAERLAYGDHRGSFLNVAEAASGQRRLLAVVLAAPLLWVGAMVLRRLPSSGGSEVSEAVWLRAGRLPLIPSLGRAVLSIVTVGMGVSLGREAAPQLVGAAAASRLSDWAALPTWQRRLLVASGAGAGFAAVYNVPLGGAVFALEVLLGTLALPLVLPALAVSVIATAVAWIFLGTAQTYQMPVYALSAGQLLWALLCGPVIGVAAALWVRLIQGASRLRPQGWGRLAAPLIVFAALGAVSIPYPQLLGNGKGIVQLGIAGGLSLGLSATLLALKPIATAACLGSGAPGGLFTPTLTVGVLLTGVLAGVWSHLWPHTVVASYALIGGGAFLAAAMQGPLSGIVIVLELTRHFDTLMAPTLLAVVGATVVARRLGSPSIYSARLSPEAETVPQIDDPAAIERLDAHDDALPPDPPAAGRPGNDKRRPGPDPSGPVRDRR